MDNKNQIEKDVCAPFIIWTLRRTGGTNFGSALFNRSSFDGVQHEPFNADRVFGVVTRGWLANHDKESLQADLIEICQRKVLMKHCVEVAPSALNRVLAEVSTEIGYQHLFLYRERPIDRLLSLHFARKSGVWGKDQAQKTTIDDEIFQDPLPIRELVAHEANCRKEMRTAFKHLCQLGARPIVVTFEDLYIDADIEIGRSQVQTVLGSLGLSLGEAEDNAFIDLVIVRGEQGTRDNYTRFVDYEKLAQALVELGDFELQKPPHLAISYPDGLPDRVAKCVVWEPQPGVQVGKIIVRGVVVLALGVSSDCRLLIEDDSGWKVVRWELSSPKMAAQFPRNPKATHARFQSDDISISDDRPAKLVIESPGGKRVLLAEIAANEV